MSGPKDYIAEPEFTKDVFEGKLTALHSLQVQLKSTFDAIHSFSLSDKLLNIKIKGSDEISARNNKFPFLLEPYTLDMNGTFGQEMYDSIEQDLSKQTALLQEELSDCSVILQTLEDKALDYRQYIDYSIYFDKSQQSFEDYKKEVALRYNTPIIHQYSPDIITQCTSELNKISFSVKKEKFSWEFRKRKESLMIGLRESILQYEKQIARIRETLNHQVIQVLSQIQEDLSDNTLKNGSNNSHLNLDEIKNKIETLIQSAEEPELRKEFQISFLNLNETESQQQKYFYDFLHDDILEKIKNNQRIKTLKELALKINRIKVIEPLQLRKDNLLNSTLSYINGQSKISGHTCESIDLATIELINENEEWIQKELKRKQEITFLKAQVISSFESLGYEVMDDLQVIDLEKSNNIYLKINQQKNFVNLKFNENGQMHYFFQIPENDILTTDEEKVKMTEMQISCDDFLSIMQKLSALGLKINLNNSKPVSAQNLTRLPQNKREKFVTEKQTEKRTTVSQKKYLNDTSKQDA